MCCCSWVKKTRLAERFKRLASHLGLCLGTERSSKKPRTNLIAAALRRESCWQRLVPRVSGKFALILILDYSGLLAVIATAQESTSRKLSTQAYSGLPTASTIVRCF